MSKGKVVSGSGRKPYDVWYEQGKWRVKFPHGVMVYDTEKEARETATAFKGGAVISPKGKLVKDVKVIKTTPEFDAGIRLTLSKVALGTLDKVNGKMGELMSELMPLVNSLEGLELIKLRHKVNDGFWDLNTVIEESRKALATISALKGVKYNGK